MSHNVITKPLIDFIVPTVDNPKLLLGCLQSLFENTHPKAFRVLVANNGTPKILDSLNREDGMIKVFDMGSNKGWEGGINSVLPYTEAEFVCLLNDDTHVVPNDPTWLLKVLSEFKDPTVGAVGPSSNYVMQKQNIFWAGIPRRMDVPVLIGLCLFVRSSLLKELDGLTENLPGGDDLDLSIRIRKKGYKLRCLRSVYIYHHGAQTGRRLHGAYWDSEDHQDKTNNELIRLHGFNKFHECRYGSYIDRTAETFNGLKEDAEGLLVKENIRGSRVLDLGCGDNKTVPEAIGVDVFPKGESIPTLTMGQRNGVSQADVVAAVDALPFEPQSVDCVIARHIFEHVIDPIVHLREWDRVLKLGGRLIVAVPDQDICSTIPLNPEHVHAYTESSLTSLIEAVLPHFKKVMTQKANNGMSFVGVYDKQ